MQQTIQILSDETINQIAAGEVIESPSSVIKELIENALDAKAEKIVVEIAGGGLKRIKVIDDGIGMSSQDAHLAILRHATSKILKAQDLFKISTKGFRGEALASIAAISKMTLTTALEGELGILLEIENGKILQEKPSARNHGTTVEVRSLFYNVPARKKFQKSAAAISAEVFRMVTTLALSHPEVHFELISNGRKTLNTSYQNDLHSRAKELLGEEFTKGSFSIDFREGPLFFSGIIGAPTNTRKNKMGQFLFINRRAVNCLEISEAIRRGYATRLDEKRHPIFLLHLDVPTELIDVNVHPQKLQVRLREEELLRMKIIEAVEKGLSVYPSPLPPQPSNSAVFEPVEIDFSVETFRESFPENEEEDLFQNQETISDPIGLFGRYFFVREKEELVIVDLKAAQSRLLFEDLVARENQIIEKQGLLVPFSIELDQIETAMVLTHLEAIENFGFELKWVVNGSFMVKAIPSFILEKEVKSLIVDMAHHLQEFIGKDNYANEREKKLARCVCRFVKGKVQYTEEEGKHLLKRLQQCENPLHSPKGQLTMVRLNHEELENFFRAD